MSGPRPGPNNKLAADLRRERKSYEEIAEILGISRARVGQILKKAGLSGYLPQKPLPKRRQGSKPLDNDYLNGQTED